MREALNAAIQVQLLCIRVAAEHLTNSVSTHDNQMHVQASVRQISSACEALQMLLYCTDR